MTDHPQPGAFPVIPCQDLEAALPFWEQMGFVRTGGNADYLLLTGWDCEVHLRRGDPPPWHVPENNPFGIFIRTRHVDRIAELMDEFVIRPGGILGHREWGLYEVALNGPDNLLIRIGWPSSLIEQR